MRILHLIDHLGLGGAQTALADLVSHWPVADDRLHVVGLGSRSELRCRFRPSPRLEIETLGGSRWELAGLRHVERLLQRTGYDIVHAHLCKSVIAGLWARRPAKTRLVIHLHGEPRHDFAVFRWAMRLGWSRADAVIAVSKHTAQAARQQLHIAAPRLHQIYNPLSGLAAERPARSAAAWQIRRELGIGPDCPVLGFVGRLIPIKGLGVLLRALADCRTQPRPDNLHLIVVGDGPLAEDLQEQTDQLGLTDRVHFVGSQTDVAPFFQAFDIAVFPSSTEGLPVAVVEAIRFGVPVIASRVGGIPEVIQDGHSGCLIPSGDVEALAHAILALADAPQRREEMAQTARQTAEQHFGAEKVGHRVRELYGQLLEGRSDIR
ncbi:MAG: glycosyltransferase [Pirellulaceae bacterium]|nr:glycosyltransferase [Pirellulaceae bacterium]